MILNRWFFFFFVRALSQRKGRFIISSLAVLLSVAVVTALVTLSSGVGEKIGNELKQYGANMIVTHGDRGAIERETAEGIVKASGSIRDYAFHVYGAAAVHGMNVEVIAMEPDKMLGYRVEGNLPGKDNEIMVGENLKGRIGARVGETVLFENGTESLVTGIFEKGSEEDFALVVPLKGVHRLLGVRGISAVLLNADAKYLDEVKNEIAAQYPSLDVKTVRQVAVAEERILTRMQLLMMIVTVVVVFSSIIALGSTMSANVIERTREIGLMKAMGATAGNIRNFFVAEAALAGLAGAIVGYIAGVGAAEAVSMTAFDSYISLRPLFILIALPLGVFISVLSTFLPVRDAMKLLPARILRGE